MGMEILRLRKRRHVLEEMRLDSSDPHKPDRRIPLVGLGVRIQITPRNTTRSNPAVSTGPK